MVAQQVAWQEISVMCSYVCHFFPQLGLVWSREFGGQLATELMPMTTHHVNKYLSLSNADSGGSFFAFCKYKTGQRNGIEITEIKPKPSGHTTQW